MQEEQSRVPNNGKQSHWPVRGSQTLELLPIRSQLQAEKQQDHFFSTRNSSFFFCFFFCFRRDLSSRDFYFGRTEAVLLERISVVVFLALVTSPALGVSSTFQALPGRLVAASAVAGTSFALSFRFRWIPEVSIIATVERGR